MNNWYTVNKRSVDALLYRLQELKLKQSIEHEINVNEIARIVNSLVKENSDLTAKLKEFLEENKKQKDVINKFLKPGE